MWGSSPCSGRGRQRLVWNLQMDSSRPASCRAREKPWSIPLGQRWAVEGYMPLPPSPTLFHPLPPSLTLSHPRGLLALIPFSHGINSVSRNHTQACDIYGYGVGQSISLGTNVWTSVGPEGVGEDHCHGSHGPLLGSLGLLSESLAGICGYALRVFPSWAQIGERLVALFSRKPSSCIPFSPQAALGSCSVGQGSQP